MSKPPERLTPMKLPNDQLQTLKLRKLRPIKRSLTRLSKAGLFKSTQGKSLGASVTAAKQSKSMRVALHLLLVRPWVLLIGFWLLSMAGGTLALNGMLSPRKLKMALPEPAAIESPVALSSQIKVTPDSDEALPGEVDNAPSEPEIISIGGQESETAAESSSGFPLLPVGVLVGGCATGCLVMSRRRAMARMSTARARGRARIRKATPVRVGQPVSKTIVRTAQKKGSTAKGVVSKDETRSVVRKTARKVARPAAIASNTKTATPASKPKKRRQRSRKSAVSKPVATSGRVLASRKTAQPTPAQARVSKRQVRRASMRAASRRQPMVSVVPANESHALDWNNGSLAHQMDVRTHRSAM